MSQRRYAARAVKIIHPHLESTGGQGLLHLLEVPPRSRLYGLAPREGGTIWRESLTSYLNRLGWKHGVSPRALVAQELAPHLSNERFRQSPKYLSNFARTNAQSLNGVGELSVEWTTLLERLTTRSDLHLLTISHFIGDPPSHKVLRKQVAWCSQCYTEWQKAGLPIFQPLLWMLLVVTHCTKHRRRLETVCPFCQRNQSAIALQTLPGHCTHCNRWLGAGQDSLLTAENDQETIAWQEWVLQVLEDLRGTSEGSGELQWESFFTHLAIAMQEKGAFATLAHLTGFDRVVFYAWVRGTERPSLEMLLQFCYVCQVTPLQVMKNQLTPLKEVLESGRSSRPPWPRRAYRQVDRDRCLSYLQAVLDGREEPLGMHHLAIRLGLSENAIRRHFPHECAVITELSRVYRRQRSEQRVALWCEEVQQAVMTLHAHGQAPSLRKVRELLADANIIREPEVRRAFHATRKALGVEQ